MNSTKKSSWNLKLKFQYLHSSWPIISLIPLDDIATLGHHIIIMVIIFFIIIIILHVLHFAWYLCIECLVSMVMLWLSARRLRLWLLLRGELRPTPQRISSYLTAVCMCLLTTGQLVHCTSSHASPHQFYGCTLFKYFLPSLNTSEMCEDWQMMCWAAWPGLHDLDLGC